MVLEASFLGLLPRDIADLEPYELALVLEGRRQREKERVRTTAWEIAWLVNCWSDAKVTVAQVMNEEEQRTSGGSDPASLEAFEIELELEREAQEARAAAGWADKWAGSLLDDVEIEGGG